MEYDSLKRKIGEYHALTRGIIYWYNVLDRIVEYERQNLGKLNPYQLEEIERKKNEIKGKIELYKNYKQAIAKEIEKLQGKTEGKRKIFVLIILISLIFISFIGNFKTAFFVSEKFFNPLAFLISAIFLYLFLKYFL